MCDIPIYMSSSTHMKSQDKLAMQEQVKAKDKRINQLEEAKYRCKISKVSSVLDLWWFYVDHIVANKLLRISKWTLSFRAKYKRINQFEEAKIGGNSQKSAVQFGIFTCKQECIVLVFSAQDKHSYHRQEANPMQTFSKVCPRPNLPCQMTIDLTFEKFHQTWGRERGHGAQTRGIATQRCSQSGKIVERLAVISSRPLFCQRRRGLETVCVLQRVAACCSVLQRVAACCTVLQRAAACCSMLQRAAACCSVLQRVAACCSVLQCFAVMHCACLTHEITAMMPARAYSANAGEDSRVV